MNSERRTRELIGLVDTLISTVRRQQAAAKALNEANDLAIDAAEHAFRALMRSEDAEMSAKDAAVSTDAVAEPNGPVDKVEVDPHEPVVRSDVYEEIGANIARADARCAEVSAEVADELVAAVEESVTVEAAPVETLVEGTEPEVSVKNHVVEASVEPAASVESEESVEASAPTEPEESMETSVAVEPEVPTEPKAPVEVDESPAGAPPLVDPADPFGVVHHWTTGMRVTTADLPALPEDAPPLPADTPPGEISAKVEDVVGRRVSIAYTAAEEAHMAALRELLFSRADRFPNEELSASTGARCLDADALRAFAQLITAYPSECAVADQGELEAFLRAQMGNGRTDFIVTLLQPAKRADAVTEWVRKRWVSMLVEGPVEVVGTETPSSMPQNAPQDVPEASVEPTSVQTSPDAPGAVEDVQTPEAPASAQLKEAETAAPEPAQDAAVNAAWDAVDDAIGAPTFAEGDDLLVNQAFDPTQSPFIKDVPAKHVTDFVTVANNLYGHQNLKSVDELMRRNIACEAARSCTLRLINLLAEGLDLEAAKKQAQNATRAELKKLLAKVTAAAPEASAG